MSAMAVFGVQLINASAYRPIGRYRRSKRRKSMTTLQLVADTPLRQLTLTLLILSLNHNYFRTNNAAFATGKKRTTTDESCLRMSVFSYFWTPIAADTPMN